MRRSRAREYARTYLAGLVSNVDAKNIESIAYLHDQERHRLQAFVGQSSWEHQPLLDELAIQVDVQLAKPTAFWFSIPRASTNRARTPSACNVSGAAAWERSTIARSAVYLGYVSRVEQALVNVRLYLPEDVGEGSASPEKVWGPDEGSLSYATRTGAGDAR